MFQPTTDSDSLYLVAPPNSPDGAQGADGKVVPIRPEQEKKAPRVLAVTSGKGGVGKSFISANLGLCLAATGRKVLMIDADLGLANLDLMLGVAAKDSIREVLNDDTPISEAIAKGPRGVSLLSACSGDFDIAEMDEKSRLSLFNAIDSLESDFDTLLIDTGAGIGSNAIGFAAAAQQVLVVVTPDPASMADAYAMIKVLNTRCGVKRVNLVVNMASGPQEAEMIVERILNLVARFLDVSVIPVGFVYRDEAVRRSIRACEPLVMKYPKAPVAASLRALTQRLLAEDPGESSWGGPQLFWKKIMGLSEEGAQ
jgi:flagellar biosynthesis protein FlhG